MSWALLLFSATEKIPSNLDFDDAILKPIFFSNILENSFNEIVKYENRREIKGDNYSIDFFVDEEPTGVKMLNVHNAKGLIAIIKLAKENKWQVFDTSFGDFIDLSKPAKHA